MDRSFAYRNSLKVDFHLFFLFPVLLMLLPMKYLLSILTAAIIHEAAHILSTIALGGRVIDIQLTVFGAKIDVWHKKRTGAIVSTLAGPLSGFLLLCFIHSIPLLSLCGCVQGVFNLLPLYPLDGGRIVRILRDEKYSLH